MQGEIERTWGPGFNTASDEEIRRAEVADVYFHRTMEILRARAQKVKPGDWIYILGGWAMEQFADDPKPFTREELDRVAPNHSSARDSGLPRTGSNATGAAVRGTPSSVYTTVAPGYCAARAQ